MDSVLHYMAKKHLTLANDYRTPDRNYSESCGCIAVEIAEILLAQGKTPYIAEIRGRLVGRVNRESLTPKIYQGRVTWGAHQVCGVDGLFYDPMVAEKPIAIDDYCQKAFLEEVEMNIVVPPEKIEDFLER